MRATAAPSRANISAPALPIPVPAPVIHTTLPANALISPLLLRRRARRTTQSARRRSGRGASARSSPAAPSSTRSVRRRSGSSVHDDGAGALAQELLCAVADVLKNLGDRADTVHCPGGLPHPDGVDVRILLEDRPERVERRQLLSSLSHLGLAPVPLAGHLIDQGPSGDSCGKLRVIHDVPDLGVHGVLTIALDDALLVSFRDLDGLVGRQEWRAKPGALSARCQYGGESPTAGDSARGDDRGDPAMSS